MPQHITQEHYMFTTELQEEAPVIIVLSSARSGSNWLIRLIQSSASTQIFGEIGKADYFENDRNAKQFARYLGVDTQDPELRHPGARLPYVLKALECSKRVGKIFGFKAFYYHVQQSPWIQELIFSPQSRVIHLYRDRVFDTFTSLSLARHTSIWHTKSYPDDILLDFDEPAYLRFRGEIQRRYRRWNQDLRERKRDTEVLEIEYSDIGADSALEAVSEFIDVTDIRKPRMKKQRRRNSYEYWRQGYAVKPYLEDRLIDPSRS